MTFEMFTSVELTNALHFEICDFLDSQNSSHPFQFPSWTEESKFALLRESGKLKWFASCSEHYPLGHRMRGIRAIKINRGPVCDDPILSREGNSELAHYLAKEKYIHLDISPEVVISSDGGTGFPRDRAWEPIGKPRFSLRLNLAQEDATLFSAFRKATRYEIRRAERAALEVVPADSDVDVDAFLNVYVRMAERKEFLADPLTHLRKVIGWLQKEPHRGALLIARHQQAVFGGAVIVRAGNRCWYVWGASQRNEAFSAGHLVQWKALLWAKAHGCKEYDFGGYTVGATSGPAWFKQGFGGSVVQFPSIQRTRLRPLTYRGLRLLSRV